MGYVALRKPEAEFDHYVTHRLRLEILNYGILDRFPEDLNLESEIEKIYNSIIHNELFNCIENSFSNEINQIVADRIKRSFSTNLLMDDDKPRKRLPSGISQVAADKIIGQFSMAIDDLFKGRIYAEENENSFSKEAVLNRIEEKLWAWVEEQTIQKGLNYVKQVLDGLDIYATEVLSDYMTGNGMESIIALSEKIDTIQKQLLLGSNESLVMVIFMPYPLFINSSLEKPYKAAIATNLFSANLLEESSLVPDIGSFQSGVFRFILAEPRYGAKYKSRE